MSAEAGPLRAQVRALQDEVAQLKLALRATRDGLATTPLQSRGVLWVELTESVTGPSNTSATCKILDWDGTANVDTGETIEVYAWLDYAGESGMHAKAEWCQLRQRYEFSDMDCEV